MSRRRSNESKTISLFTRNPDTFVLNSYHINVELHYASVLLRVLLVSLSDLIVFTVIVGLSYYIKTSSKRAFLEVINVI